VNCIDGDDDAARSSALDDWHSNPDYHSALDILLLMARRAEKVHQV
jgi:hypothetical protein